MKIFRGVGWKMVSAIDRNVRLFLTIGGRGVDPFYTPLFPTSIIRSVRLSNGFWMSGIEHLDND